MDDTELAELTTPTLTSVCSARANAAQIAATLLLDRLSDPDRAPSRATVQPRLVVRASSDAIAHAAARNKRGAR